MPRMRTTDIQRLVWRVYPYISAELFLRWDEAAVSAVVDALLDTFVRLNLLQGNADRSEWQRPAPTSLGGDSSVGAGAGNDSNHRALLPCDRAIAAGGQRRHHTEALEERCHLMAQRMSLLYGLNSPEFFDKSLFRNFIELLRQRDVIQMSEDGKLLFGEPLLASQRTPGWCYPSRSGTASCR